MVKKCYVIPVNKAGEAFFTVKAEKNPHNGRAAYAAGCPNLIGGNIDDGMTVVSTLAKEAGEESHNKIQLIAPALSMAIGGNANNCIFEQIHQEDVGRASMSFYVLLNSGFIVLPEPFADIPAGNKDYQETTGDIVTINLNMMSSALSKQQVAAAMIAAMPDHLRNNIPPRGEQDFRDSGSVEAVRKAIARVKSN